jgi:hypothetical protein
MVTQHSTRVEHYFIKPAISRSLMIIIQTPVLTYYSSAQQDAHLMKVL